MNSKASGSRKKPVTFIKKGLDQLLDFLGMSAEVICIIANIFVVRDGHAAADTAEDCRRFVVTKIDVRLAAYVFRRSRSGSSTFSARVDCTPFNMS